MALINYCENTLFAGYFEPINFLSNFAIIFSGLLIWRYIHQQKIEDRFSKVFALLVILTGIGSMTWHFTQTLPTLLLDILPVMIIAISSFAIIYYRLTKSRMIATVIVMGGFLLIPIAQYIATELFGLPGSNGPPIIGIISGILFFVTIVYYKAKQTCARLLLPIAFFVVAILFRQVDLLVCDIIPFGTHFLWHCFNSLAAYYLFLAIYKK